MIFDKINISEELKKERALFPPLMKEVEGLLTQSAQTDMEIISRLKGTDDSSEKPFHFSDNDFENIFTLKEIETTCINYRLRFLDSKYFKQEFPYEAIVRINEFEKRYNTKIKRFKIIAPDTAFDLQEANQDPLLFAQLGNHTFYLLHQWGRDLVWYRKFLYFPIRNIYSYFYSMLAAAFIFAFSIPFEWLQVERNNEIYIRMWFTMHCTIGFFFFIIFIGSITQSSFSSMSWKSKYINE